MERNWRSSLNRSTGQKFSITTLKVEIKLVFTEEYEFEYDNTSKLKAQMAVSDNPFSVEKNWHFKIEQSRENRKLYWDFHAKKSQWFRKTLSFNIEKKS